jgi:VPDSG-CTERM motif
MKTLILAAIRCSLVFLVTASPFFLQPAQAYTVTLQQVGSNVVATGSGAINLTGLSFPIPSLTLAEVNAGDGVIITGPHGFGPVDQYTGFMGPPSFGSGGPFAPNTGSGDFVGISGGTMFTFLLVPQGYASGAGLSDSMTFNNATFASLGVTPGTYVWTWGTGLENQNFTLQIGSVGVPGVPDGGSTVSLLGFALLGLTALRRKLSC